MGRFEGLLVIEVGDWVECGKRGKEGGGLVSFFFGKNEMLLGIGRML